jgi:hypothetical protein
MKSAACVHDLSAKRAQVYFVRRVVGGSEVRFGDPDAESSRFVMCLADEVAADRIADTLNGNRHRRAAVGPLAAEAVRPYDKPAPARTPAGKFLILRYLTVKSCF